MNDRIRGVNQGVIFIVRQSESFAGQIAAKDTHARTKVFVEFGKPKVKLERGPQTLSRFLIALGAYQKVQLVPVFGEQSGDDVAPQISGRAGYEDRHSWSDGVAEFETTAARSLSGDQSSSRGARDSRGRPSIRG